MNDKQQSAAENTDKEIWRATPDDYYSPSIHVTDKGGIGINCGGHVFVKTVEEWHKLAIAAHDKQPTSNRDPGKVEALIKAAKLVVERADLNDKGDFIISEKRFDALEVALKGVE